MDNPSNIPHTPDSEWPSVLRENAVLSCNASRFPKPQQGKRSPLHNERRRSELSAASRTAFLPKEQVPLKTQWAVPQAYPAGGWCSRVASLVCRLARSNNSGSRTTPPHIDQAS